MGRGAFGSSLDLRSLLAAAALSAAATLAATPSSAEMALAMRADTSDPMLSATATPQPDVPTVVARVDLSDQTMYVYVDERLTHTFRVSTARRGYITPVGRYQAQWLASKWRSRKYNNAPMPWSVFFHRGYAIHGTTDLRRLGRPASHGCIRLHPANAKTFFKLVQANGRDNTLITVVR